MTAPAKRGRGHPPVSEEGTARLVTYVAAPDKAELERLAIKLGTKVGPLVREAIEAHLPRVRRRVRLLAESAPPEGPDVVR